MALSIFSLDDRVLLSALGLSPDKKNLDRVYDNRKTEGCNGIGRVPKTLESFEF